MATGVLDVFKRPQGQGIWLVRAEGGTYLPNFRTGGIIALGHADDLGIKFPSDEVYEPDLDELLKDFEKAHSESEEGPKRTLKSHFNQTARFLYEIKVGDLVLTPDEPYRGRIQVGRVTGFPRFDSTPIDVVRDSATGRMTRMVHSLRRNVSWGPFISKDGLPSPLQKAFRAQQSVSNLDDHWESVYHSLYPVFLNGDNFHFSVRIGTENKIDNFTVSSLLTFLTETEVACRFSGKDSDFNSRDFDDLISDVAFSGKLALNTKARFMSPGEIWGALSSVGPDWIAYYFVYSMVFGSKIVGWDGVLDLETRHKLRDFILKRWTSKSGELIQKNLKTEAPKHKTGILEDSSKDEARE